MSNPAGDVVVGLATADLRDPVLNAAIEIAGELGARLHIVHAYRLPSQVRPSDGEGGVLDPAAVDAYAERFREEVACALGQHDAKVDVEIHLQVGAPFRVIRAIAEENDAGLVIVGATRRQRVWRGILSSTAEGVVRGARMPVLVLRDPSFRRIERVLAATHPSEEGAAVLASARTLLQVIHEPHCELRSLYVGADASPLIAMGRDALEAAAQRELDTFLGRRAAGPRRVQGKVRLGTPADEILAEATEWGADLLVIGCRRRAEPGAEFIGRTTGALLRASVGNVLVVPATPVQPEREPAPETPLEVVAA